MQGSFDHPPIVISGSRWKTLPAFLLSLPFTASIGFVLASPSRADPSAWDYIWGGAALLVFGGCSLLFACHILWPNKLIVAPDGVTVRTTFGPFNYAKSVHYEWAEIAGFELWRYHSFDAVGVRLKRNEAGASIANPTLPGSLQLSPKKTHALLNEALRQWTPR